MGRGRQTLVGGALLCTLLAGCTSVDSEPQAADPSPSGAPTSSATPEPVTVSLGVYGPAPLVEAYDELAEAFTDQNPHVTVEIEPHEDAEGLVASIQGGDAPDVFLMDQRYVPQLLQDAALQPVDGLLEARQVDFGDGYQRGGLTAFAADARLQCMPHDVSPVVVYYNQDLVDLSRLGVDGEEPPNALDGWDWETFTRAARRAARGDADGVHIEPTLEALAPFVWSAGSDIVDDTQSPTTLTLSDADTRAALEQVLALVRDPEITPSVEDLEKRGALSRFRRGELGMILGTRALTPTLRSADDLDFDVMPLPSLGRFRTIADMNGYCLSAGTDHVEEAADLLAFAVGRQGASITARTGYVVPSNLEVAHGSAFEGFSEEPRSSFIFNEAVRRAQALPFVPTWPELSEQVSPSLERMFYAPVIDLETLLTQVDEQSVEVLAPEEE